MTVAAVNSALARARAKLTGGAPADGEAVAAHPVVAEQRRGVVAQVADAWVRDDVQAVASLLTTSARHWRETLADRRRTQMGRITVTEFVSLDGVMEAPGGEEFKYPGWSFQFDRGDDGNEFKLQETREADALLIGRVTYESFAGAWPKRNGEFADKFNAMPKYVVSSTLKDPDWNNTTVLSGDVVEEVTKLKNELDAEIQVPGSRQLVLTLFEHDLVDKVHLMVFPVLLGTGRRAFGDMSEKKDLRLVESRPVGPDGVIVFVYERA